MDKVDEKVGESSVEGGYRSDMSMHGHFLKVDSEKKKYARIFSILKKTPFSFLSLFPDEDGKLIIRSAGGRCAELYGYESHELIGMDIEMLEPPEKRGLTNRIISKTSSVGLRFQVERLRKDGSSFPAVVNAARVEIGGSFSFVVVEADIEKIEVLADDMEIMKTAVDQSANMIVITDTNGDINYVNRSFEEITGYSFEEVKGKNPRILKSGVHDEMFYRDLWDTISSGEVWKGEFINRRKDGELYTEKAIITPVVGDRGSIKAYIAIKEDITEEKRMSEQLMEVEKERRRENINHLLLSMLLLIFRYADERTVNEIIRALGDILEERLRPYFDEQIKEMSAENSFDKREAYMVWLSHFFRDIGVSNNLDGEKKKLFIYRCPWKEMEMDANPCILCRTLISRSFDWSGGKGRWIQHSSIAAGEDKCTFEFRFQEERE